MKDAISYIAYADLAMKIKELHEIGYTLVNSSHNCLDFADRKVPGLHHFLPVDMSIFNDPKLLSYLGQMRKNQVEGKSIWNISQTHQ